MAPPVPDYVPMFKAPPKNQNKFGKNVVPSIQHFADTCRINAKSKAHQNTCMAFLLHSLLLKKQSLPKSNATGGETQG